MINPNGWLPYGATDDSIIFQHSLKTALTSADITLLGTPLQIGSAALTWDDYGSVLHGHTPTHDAELGMLCLSSVDGTTEVGYRINAIGTKMDDGGQISFEMQRELVCRSLSTYGTSGDVVAADKFMLSANASAGGAQTLLAKGTVGYVYSAIGMGANVPNIHSAGKGDFVTVNLGWVGGRVGGIGIVAIDGQVVSTAARNVATLSGFLNNLFLGNDRGVAGSYATRYMRNLQISTRSPMFAIHPLLRNVGMISDSINETYVATGNYRDSVTSYSMLRRLAERGHFVGAVTGTVDGGARMDNSADGGTTDYIYTQLTTLLATRPTVVIIRGGTNDALNDRCSQSTWQAAVAAYITACMAVTSVRRVVFLGIPSAAGSTSQNTAAFKSERVIGEAKIQAACDAWRADNPADTRDVIFADDIYSRLGAESPAAHTFVGQTAGTYADIHLSGYGHYVHGKAVADWLIGELGTA